MQPVVIPPLKPSLDDSMNEDTTLCPVRAFRYYFDKTKDLRKSKHLLFVSVILTIQTVILAYENSDVETQGLSNVKAHDFRAWRFP